MDYPDFDAKGKPNCRTVEDPELFFPEPYARGAASINAQAKSVCNKDGGCVYKDECLAWALFNTEPGVWGGTSENERRLMKRRSLPMRVISNYA